MGAWVSHWDREERYAYSRGIEKGKALAQEGASLRDRFAMAALAGMDVSRSYPASEAAKWAYDVAEAMMDERRRRDDEIPF